MGEVLGVPAVPGVELRPVPDTKNRYFVGNDGEIYNFRGKRLKRRHNGTGYRVAAIYYPDTGKKYVFVHKLVAKCFLLDTEENIEVGFKGDREDCRPSNLLVKMP